MITIDRLFHIDLTHVWNRASARLDPLPAPKFDEFFSKPADMLASNPAALISGRVLFPNDAQYLAEVVRRHASSTLFIALVTNREDPTGELTLWQDRLVLPLNATSIEAVRALLPKRLACDIPLLAEVEIFLDGPHIE